MTIPPYIPGTVLALSSIVTLGIGVLDMVDPVAAGNWTDRGLILALLATMFITCGVLLRMLLKDRTKREAEHKVLLEKSLAVHQSVLTFLLEEKTFRDGIAREALHDQFEAGRKKTRTTRVMPKDPPESPDPPQ
jgi:hypothetical protein